MMLIVNQDSMFPSVKPNHARESFTACIAYGESNAFNAASLAALIHRPFAMRSANMKSLEPDCDSPNRVPAPRFF